MTRNHHAVQTFPRLEQDIQPSRPHRTGEEGSDYLDYLLALADRLINGDRNDEYEAA